MKETDFLLLNLCQVNSEWYWKFSVWTCMHTSDFKNQSDAKLFLRKFCQTCRSFMRKFQLPSANEQL